MGVSSFLVLAGTMENTPIPFLPQDFTQKILHYLNERTICIRHCEDL
jgi:hypothetical protein